MKRYIGNKASVLDKIELFINNNNLNAKTFFDIYAGTGSVANYFRSKYIVNANDIMEYSKVVLKAKLSFEKGPGFSKFIKEFKQDPIDYLNSLSIETDSSCIIWNNFSPQGNRMYFTEENALKIDAARKEIDKLLLNGKINKNEWYYLLACIISTANSKGNTTGTFGAYLKKFSVSTLKPIRFSHIDITIGNKGKVYSADSKKIINKIETDILYMDPPYTAIDYSQAYHFLESLALYDLPEYKGITGRRPNNDKVSKFTKKTTALDEFGYMFKHARGCKNIVISYSTHGIVSVDDISRLLSEYYNEVVVERFKHKKYRNVFSNEKGDLEELLILGKGRI